MTDLQAGNSAIAPPPSAPACQRCGDFAALEQVWGRLLCANCRGRMHEIQRTPMTTISILTGVGQLVREIGLPTALLLIAFDFPLVLVEWIGKVELPLLAQNAYDLFVSLIAVGATMHLAQQVIMGREKRSLGDALRVSLRSYGRLLRVRFTSNLISGLMMLLLIVPGVLRALSYTIVLPIALHDRDLVGQELDFSKARMHGHRGAAFGAYLLCSAPFVMALGVVIGIAMFESLGLPNLSFEASPIPGMVFSTLVPALLLPYALIPAVCYAKLQAQPATSNEPSAATQIT